MDRVKDGYGNHGYYSQGNVLILLSHKEIGEVGDEPDDEPRH